jgi:hypothetical protein
MTELSRGMVHFNAVYVIESLPEGDYRTGQRLYDEIIYPATAKHGLFADYKRIRSLDEFTRKLRDILHAAKTANHLPFIHLEAHGFDEGFQLEDGTLVRWASIRPLLVEINTACRMNLVFVAVSCEGWLLTGSLMPSDRSPVCVVIGPPSTMTAQDLLDAAKRFYSTLFAALSVGDAEDGGNRLDDAYRAMNEGRDYSDWAVKPGYAEILFCRVFREYMALRTEAVRKDKENEMVATIAKRDGLDLRQTAILRERIRADLADFRGQFDRLRETFLMLDLFPENAGRFGLTFDKCLPKPEER